MSDFVQASVTTDPSTLTDQTIDAMNVNLTTAGYPSGWSAADATLAVILIATLCQIFADIAQVSANVAVAVFRAFGTQLLNVAYSNGTFATVDSTWTFTSAAPAGGYTIAQGTAVIVSGQVFYAQSDVTASQGATSATVMLVASQVGSAYNDLGGVNQAAQAYEQIDWVSSITTVGVSSGGADQETDDEYGSRLVGALQLQAPRPITADDFAGMVLSDLAATATGVTVGRSTSIDGYYPVARTLSTGGTGPNALTATADLTSGSATVTSMTPPYPGAVPAVGATVTDSAGAVPANTTVLASPAPTDTGFTLSANATASETGDTLTVGAWTSVERCTTTFVTDTSGNALSDADMDALASWLGGYRELGFLAFVEAPSYTTVYVSASVHVLDGYDATSVASNVQAALVSFLSPATWGASSVSTGQQGWSNENTVRYLKLVGVVEAVPGVDYCSALTLGTAATPTGTADITLSGPAPLPQTADADIVITTV